MLAFDSINLDTNTGLVNLLVLLLVIVLIAWVVVTVIRKM